RLLTAKPSPSDLLMLSKLPEHTELRALLATSVLFADFCSVQADSTALYQEIIWEGHAVFPTTAGAIILAGTQDNTHHFEEAPLLLIDCGGNDQYSGTFSIASASQAVSLTIDARGEDEYTSQASPLGAGAACLGFSALLDLGSEGDRYQGEARCFGYAAAGVALLFDADGDSRYAITHHGLGTGEGGIAMLIDTGGEDHYEAVHHAQGCGILGGFGLLLDTQGADAYIAKATPVLFPSAQRPDLNFSGCQGFGMGRFGAQSDGIALPGGIGCLIDGSGDDLYQAAIFAQGAGYGYGIGHLVDFGGNDRYTVTWYGQGSAAHQAVGILIDESGDDSYTAEQYMACGAATDLSLALFHDRAGADTYSALNASLGYSIDNSLALFLEEQGDDSYTLTNGLGFGSARNERPATIRGLWPTWGVFFDAHGNDQYRGSAPSNGKDWSAANPAERGFGIGLDREENKTGDKQP
ncbi:MAG: hypothetical protein RBU29_03820, partial [bacterium]|nr:hypothetical protein [bacterium]